MELIGDFQKSAVQMFSARFVWVLVKSLLLTVVLLVGISFGVGVLLDFLLPESFSLPVIGEVNFIDEILSVAAVPLILVLSVFLMFPVAALFIGLFLDEIAGAVERRHYPQLPPARGLPLAEAVIDAVQFGAVFVAVNAVALLVYVIAAPLAPFVFWAVNGYLLGREYFSQVALRRVSAVDAKALRRRHRGRVWLAGVLMAIPLSIPLVNLIIPILGVATFTHQFQRLR